MRHDLVSCRFTPTASRDAHGCQRVSARIVVMVRRVSLCLAFFGGSGRFGASGGDPMIDALLPAIDVDAEVVQMVHDAAFHPTMTSRVGV